MPANPTVTLTATLQGVSGAASSTAKLRITLCNFTGQVPRVIWTISGWNSGIGYHIGDLVLWNAVVYRSIVDQSVVGGNHQPDAVGSIYWAVYNSGPRADAILSEVSQEQYYTSQNQLSFPIIPNDYITPAGTFYCVQVFDGAGNCIEASNYRVLSSGGPTQDLASLPTYDPNAVTMIGVVPNGPIPGRMFQLPVPATGSGAELYYNRILQGPRDFSVSGLFLALNFDTADGDQLYLKYPARLQSGEAYRPFLAIANGIRPGQVFTVPTAPPDAQFVGVFINGSLQPPATYNYIPGQLTLTTAVQDPKDTVFVLFVTTTGTVAIVTPAGDVPGTAYTFVSAPKAVIGIFDAQMYLVPGIDWNLSGTALTLTNASQGPLFALLIV